jgi:MFS family permease
MTRPAVNTARVLGLRANLAQFVILVTVNALVGGMLGQERTVLPLLATDVFGVATYTAALTYILAFGLSKAITNYLAGTWSERYGRKPVLVAGWVVAVPVPLMLILADAWWLVVAANVLLGISQGLTWSTTVIMKIDLVGPRQRGLAMGLNESAGYLAVAFTALLTGYIAAQTGLRPEPFLVGVAYAALGLGLSTLAVRETRQYARQEGNTHGQPSDLSEAEIFVLTSVREPALSSASQAGLVNNLTDGLAWGLFPILFTSVGLSLGQVAVLVAIYPAVWGVGQLITGALSDRWGRKHLITSGMLLQATALAAIAAAHSFAWWAVAAAFLGAGTAMVSPTLLAAVSDVSHPSWRARAVGVYRLWRDLGFAVGALLTGLLADAWGIRPAVWAVAGLTALSGVVVAWRMYETHHA